MNTPGAVENLKTAEVPPIKTVGDDLLDQFYVEMSELIDQLHTEISMYTPKMVDSYLLLRSNAAKIFLHFIGDIKELMAQVKRLDANLHEQGTLFDYE